MIATVGDTTIKSTNRTSLTYLLNDLTEICNNVGSHTLKILMELAYKKINKFYQGEKLVITYL